MKNYLKFGRVEILVLTGGNAAILIKMAALIPELRDDFEKQIVLVIDVAEEIKKLPAVLPSNVYVFKLGEGETAQSIAIKTVNQRTLAKRKGAVSENGCSQQRTLGHDAMQRLAKQFVAFIRTVLVPAAFRLGQGVLSLVHLRVISSICGGTGAGAGRLVAEIIAAVFLESTSAVVQTTYQLTGAQSYLACGPGVVPNSGACLSDVLAHVCDPQRHPREVLSGLLMELPQVTEEQRQKIVAVIYQTLLCENYSQIMDPLTSNVTADEDPYHFQLLRIALHEELDTLKDVAPTIASRYIKHLEGLVDLSKQRYSDAVKELQFEIRSSPQQRPSAKQLLETLDRETIEPDDFIALVKSPEKLYNIRVNALSADGALLGLSDAARTWAIPPTTTTQIATRQRQFIGSLNLLEKERKGIEQELYELLREQTKQEARIRRLLKLWTPHSAWQRTKSLMSSSNQVLAELADAIVKLRAAFDAIWLAVAELDEIKNAIQAVRAEQQQLNQKLLQLQSVLATLRYRSAEHDAQEYVIPKPLDTVLIALWQCDSQSPQAQLGQIMLHAVQCVTLTGLAKCLGCRDARIETLAQALIERNYEFLCPPWGGEARQKPGMLLHALPPLEQTTFDQLSGYVRDRMPERRLLMTDSVYAGIRPIDLEIVTVNSREEVMTDLYEDALRQALNSPHPGLYFPFGRPQ